MTAEELLDRAHDQWQRDFTTKVVPLRNKAWASADLWDFYTLNAKADRLDAEISRKLRKAHRKFFLEVCGLDIENESEPIL